MSWQKKIRAKRFSAAKKILVMLLLPAIGSLSALSIPQAAKSLEFNSSGLEVGQPSNTTGGGVRGTRCTVVVDEDDETAKIKGLMPSQSEDLVGKTTSKTPALYWYVPEIIKQDKTGNTLPLKKAELVVLDEEGKEVYFTQFTLAASPAIIKHDIPASAGLEEGKKYQWVMAIVCDPDDRSSDEFVAGELRVVGEEAALEDALASAKTALEKAEAYAKAQIWYETVDSLAKARQKYQQEWEELLESVGLPDWVVEAEVVDCCEAEN